MAFHFIHIAYISVYLDAVNRLVKIELCLLRLFPVSLFDVANNVQWNFPFGTLYSRDTSIHPSDTKFGPRKMFTQSLFLFSLHSRDTSILTKGTLFLGIQHLSSIQGHLSTQKVTQKEFEMYTNHNDAFTN